MMKRYAIFFAFLLSCADPDRTRATLEAEGFTRISITGYEWTSCGHGDTYCTGFDALAPSGRRVHGAIGCGMQGGCTKGCTVRLEP